MTTIMERTVPTSISEEIQLYRSTIYSLLRSSAEVKIRTIEEVHAGMHSLLHQGARDTDPDISAFIYSYLRLPECFPQVRVVILGQSSEIFRQHGFPNVESWTSISARARRRRCFYDGTDQLACYIASRSDIEDVVPCLTAFQIEWNKLHLLFQNWVGDLNDAPIEPGGELWNSLCQKLKIGSEDMERLRTIWGRGFITKLNQIKNQELSISLRLLSGSLTHYLRATHQWIENITQAVPAIMNRPIYFISSNPHSVPNLLTGFAQKNEEKLVDYVEQSNDPDLQREWRSIQDGIGRSSKDNFLYYVLKKFQGTNAGHGNDREQLESEAALGITRIASEHTFDVDAQVIEINRLDFSACDPRICSAEAACLSKSDALILNIDYPLGLGAYNVLSTLTIHADVIGVYSMGKAASLNAVRGDVILPNVVQDEISHNTYLFENCFSTNDVAPYLVYGTVLDNQKAITVLGTFLQNIHIMDIFYREGFADIEMEAGNFLSALYEASRPKRYPTDEIVNLYGSPIDFGFLHYVSDTPLTKGKNLGAGTLSYYGMDSTYASSIAILRRIFQMEQRRLQRA
jgi:hypothetical protein